MEQDRKWLFHYNLLVNYIKNNGGKYWDQTMPQKYSENNKNLGQWFSRQKISYKNNKLSKKRIELLTEIKFPFSSWISRESQNHIKWKKKMDLFIENKDDKNIKKWVSEQRKLYFSNNLIPKRKRLLEEINFDWNANNVRWKTIFKMVKKEIESNGVNHLLNNEIIISNINISEWLKKQKQISNTLPLKKKELIDGFFQ